MTQIKNELKNKYKYELIEQENRVMVMVQEYKIYFANSNTGLPNYLFSLF
jgi:hypothetical protein